MKKTGLSDLSNVIHKTEEAMLKQTTRIRTRTTMYLNLSSFTFIRLHLPKLPILFSSLENDDMESSKRCVKPYFYP